MRKTVILDTNVLISACLKTGSLPDLVFRHVLLHQKLALSKEVWAEYSEVLHRERFVSFAGFNQAAEALLINLAHAGEWFEPSITIHKMYDPGDNKFLELAIEANADFLLTGNSKHFDFDAFQDTLILSPRMYANLFLIDS
jgi:putative PIN family toxin of toxin-antitoxin system